MKEEDLELGQWSARRFVDSGEKPEFIRTCEVKSVLKLIHSYGQPGSDEGFHRPSATHE